MRSTTWSESGRQVLRRVARVGAGPGTRAVALRAAAIGAIAVLRAGRLPLVAEVLVAGDAVGARPDVPALVGPLLARADREEDVSDPEGLEVHVHVLLEPAVARGGVVLGHGNAEALEVVGGEPGVGLRQIPGRRLGEPDQVGQAAETLGGALAVRQAHDGYLRVAGQRLVGPAVRHAGVGVGDRSREPAVLRSRPRSARRSCGRARSRPGAPACRARCRARRRRSRSTSAARRTPPARTRGA